jgi:hypothetical protein
VWAVLSHCSRAHVHAITTCNPPTPACPTPAYDYSPMLYTYPFWFPFAQTHHGVLLLHTPETSPCPLRSSIPSDSVYLDISTAEARLITYASLIANSAVQGQWLFTRILSLRPHRQLERHPTYPQCLKPRSHLRVDHHPRSQILRNTTSLTSTPMPLRKRARRQWTTMP